MKISKLDIVKFREKHKISQSDFAQLIGVSLRTVQNYEAGGKIPESKNEILRTILFNKSEVKEPTATYKKTTNEDLLKLAVEFAENYQQIKDIPIVSNIIEIEVLKRLLEKN